MDNSLTKIIVKVGDKSNVRFSHCKVFRALVAEDLFTLANKYEDCSIVIIENIDVEENDKVKKFIEEYTSKNENNSVLFFIADENDEVTSGLADELDYNIYMTLKDIYNVIKAKYGVNVSAFVEDKKDDTVEDYELPGVFDNLDLTSNSDIDEAVKSIDDTASSELFETMVSDREKAIERSEAYKEKVMDTNEEDAESSDIKAKIQFDAAEENSESKVKLEKAPEVHLANDALVTSEDEPVQENKAPVKSDIASDEKDEEIEKLQMLLRDAKYDYNVILKDIREANSRIDELEQLIRSLKDEKKAIKDRFDELLSSDTVLEDPISLTQYEGLKSDLEDREQSIKKLESTIEDLKNTVELNESTIEAKDKEVEELRSRLKALETDIQSGEIHRDVKDKYESDIARYQEAADKLRNENAELSDKLEELNNSLSDSLEQVAGLKRKLSMETDYRKESLELVQTTFFKMKDFKEAVDASEKIVQGIKDELEKSRQNAENLRKQNDSLNEELTDNQLLIESKDKEIEKLEKTVSDCDTRISLSTEYSENEIRKLKESIQELEAQLKLAQDMLKQKEEQYNVLVKQGSVQELNDDTVIETNRSLEKVNKSLMEQVSTLTKELNNSRSSQSDMQSKISEYTEEIARLRSMSSGAPTNSATSAMNEYITPIEYVGTARIIGVFGSGSFGTTTMAMSLLYKLASTARVLYLDFDLVAPNADAWFSKTPICRDIPGINPKDARMTGLGIFFEKGTSVFTAYVDRIINHVEKTKGGCVDYLSGAYYTVNRQKLYSADYSTFFNIIGGKYDYIIIDFGRLGSSDVNDQIIKAVSDIAYRSVVVTTSERFEVRNFMMKLSNNKFRPEGIAWMLNMCSGTNIDPNVRKTLDSFDSGMLFEDQSLRGTRDKFTRDRMNRDRLDLFINSALFKR